MILKPILRGLLTYIPAADRRFAKATRGTNSARYCYSVWLRHLVMAHENGLLSATTPVPAGLLASQSAVAPGSVRKPSVSLDRGLSASSSTFVRRG